MNNDFETLNRIDKFNELISDHNKKINTEFIVNIQKEYIVEMFDKHINNIGLDFNYVIIDKLFYEKNDHKDTQKYLKELVLFNAIVLNIFEHKKSLSNIDFKNLYYNNKIDLRDIEKVTSVNQLLGNVEGNIRVLTQTKDIRTANLQEVDDETLEDFNPYLLLSYNTIRNSNDIKTYSKTSSIIIYLDEENTNQIETKRKGSVKILNFKLKIKSYFSSIIKHDKINMFYEITSLIAVLMLILVINNLIKNDMSEFIILFTVSLLPIGIYYKYKRFHFGQKIDRYRSKTVIFSSYLILYICIVIFAAFETKNNINISLSMFIFSLLIMISLVFIERFISIIDIKFILGPLFFLILLLGYANTIELINNSILSVVYIDDLIDTGFILIPIIYLVITLFLLWLQKLGNKSNERKQK